MIPLTTGLINGLHRPSNYNILFWNKADQKIQKGKGNECKPKKQESYLD